jgi:hypothetical protein
MNWRCFAVREDIPRDPSFHMPQNEKPSRRDQLASFFSWAWEFSPLLSCITHALILGVIGLVGGGLVELLSTAEGTAAIGLVICAGIGGMLGFFSWVANT